MDHDSEDSLRQQFRQNGLLHLLMIETHDPDAPPMGTDEYRCRYEAAVNWLLASTGRAHPIAFVLEPAIYWPDPIRLLPSKSLN